MTEPERKTWNVEDEARVQLAHGDFGEPGTKACVWVETLASEVASLRSFLQNVAQLARLIRVKADAAERLSKQYAEGALDGRNWAGLAAELNDSAWSLEELAAGRPVSALTQGAKNRERIQAEKATAKDQEIARLAEALTACQQERRPLLHDLAYSIKRAEQAESALTACRAQGEAKARPDLKRISDLLLEQCKVLEDRGHDPHWRRTAWGTIKQLAVGLAALSSTHKEQP